MGKLEYIRRNLGLTKKEAAKRLDLQYVYYCLFEKCKKRGSFDVWERVQEEFNIPDEEMWKIVREHLNK